MSLRLRSKVWLENESGKAIIGEGRLRIFLAVRRTGSISKAALLLGMQYRNVWAKIKDAEHQCGFRIVETSRRGSSLTQEGEHLLRTYSELQRSCQRSARSKFRKLFSNGKMNTANGQGDGFPAKGESDDQEGNQPERHGKDVGLRG
jgi:molybdate transport system regulatory protein